MRVRTLFARMLRGVVVLLVTGTLMATGFLFSAPRAAAEMYPGQALVTDATIDRMVDVAYAEWARAGSPVDRWCARAAVRVVLADSLGDVDGAAVQGRAWTSGQCEIALLRGMSVQALSLIGQLAGRGPLVSVCAVVVHEVGHLGGHTHEEGGWMAGLTVPGCVALGAELTPEAPADAPPAPDAVASEPGTFTERAGLAAVRARVGRGWRVQWQTAVGGPDGRYERATYRASRRGSVRVFTVTRPLAGAPLRAARR